MNFNFLLTNFTLVSMLFSCNTNLFENTTYVASENCDSLTKDIYSAYETAVICLVDSNRKDTLMLKNIDSLICLMDSNCVYYPQMVMLKYKISIELGDYLSGIIYLENVSEKYFSSPFGKVLSVNHLKMLGLLDESKYKELNELRDQTQQYLRGFLNSKDSILVGCYIDGLNTIDLTVSQVNNIIYNLKLDKDLYSKDVYNAKLSNYHNILNEKMKNALIENQNLKNNKAKQINTHNDIEQF